MKKVLFTHFKQAMLLLVFLMAFTASGFSVTYTFTGTGNWSDPSNWEGAVPPDPLPAEDAIHIFGYCFMDVDRTINGFLAIGSTGVMTINSGDALDNAGGLYNIGTLNNYGILNSNNFLEISAGTLNNYGYLYNNGTLFSDNNSALYNNGTLYNYGYLDNTSYLNNNGDLTNSSILSNNGPMDNNGTFLNNHAGSILNNNLNGTLNNNSILYNEGTLNNIGVLNNNNTLNNNNVLHNNNTLNNLGVLNITGNAILSNSGYLNNVGTLDNYPGGTLNNNSGGTLDNNLYLFNDGALANDGNLNNHSGSTLNNLGFLKGNGTIVQSGTCKNIVSGVIAPGASPGKMTVSGSITLGDGAYECEIEGTGQGTTYDWLSISSTATLTDAKLVVVWGFTPSAGQEYTVLTCGSRTGEFGAVTIPPVSGLTFSVTYSATNVKITAQTALPVELTHFNGSVKAGSVLLEWNTATEQNNAGFEIERSDDGRGWSELGFVKSRGAGILPQAYTYTDEHPLSGRNYYRLRQVDLDGKSEYSNTIMVTLKKTATIRLYPNPTQAYLYAENLPEPADYSIKNAAGQTLLSGSLSPGRAIDLQNITPGLYYLCLDQQVIGFVKYQ